MSAAPRSTGSFKDALKERGNDLYETPEVATLALLKAERFDGPVWEPACGRLAIVNVMREAGYEVRATDLVDYGVGAEHGRDFLMELSAEGCRSIVTNPPFKLANEFVAHALSFVPKVAMLLRLGFLEGTKRSGVMDGGHLARVHVFKNRLPMMFRDGIETGDKGGSAIAFAWFVWDRNHTGPTHLHRVSWGGA